MSFRVNDQIDRIRELADEWPEYLSVAELAEQYRETEDAPTDEDEPPATEHEQALYYAETGLFDPADLWDEPPLVAYAVWDAVNKRWVETT